MGRHVRSSSSPKALAAWLPMPTLADAMDAVRLSVDRFCLLAGVEADKTGRLLRNLAKRSPGTLEQGSGRRCH